MQKRKQITITTTIRSVMQNRKSGQNNIDGSSADTTALADALNHKKDHLHVLVALRALAVLGQEPA